MFVTGLATGDLRHSVARFLETALLSASAVSPRSFRGFTLQLVFAVLRLWRCFLINKWRIRMQARAQTNSSFSSKLFLICLLMNKQPNFLNALFFTKTNTHFNPLLCASVTDPYQSLLPQPYCYCYGANFERIDTIKLIKVVTLQGGSIKTRIVTNNVFFSSCLCNLILIFHMQVNS